MPITLEDGDAVSVIRLEGDLDISCSDELKRVLLEAISLRKELQLDVARATDLDITSIQLLWAAAREVEKSGMSFVVAGEIPENVGCAVREAGFENFPVPPAFSSARGNAIPVNAEDVDDRQV